MVVEKEKVVTCVYNAYVEGKDGQEDLMEQATEQRPLVYCHGERMMLPKFEQALEGLKVGDKFDFQIVYHFVGEIRDIRDAAPKELEAIRNPHHCGGCSGNCDDCSSECNNCK